MHRLPRGKAGEAVGKPSGLRVGQGEIARWWAPLCAPERTKPLCPQRQQNAAKDLETVPDLAGSRPPTIWSASPTWRSARRIGDKFPKHIYHSIVCIGALIAHWESDHWAVDAVGTNKYAATMHPTTQALVDVIMLASSTQFQFVRPCDLIARIEATQESA
jgi:hypothetical protein